MPRKDKNIFGLLLALPILSSCNSTREYTEYNYYPLIDSLSSVRVTASMIGKYQDTPGSGRETIRKSPYRLSIGLLDTRAQFVSAKIRLATIKGENSNQFAELSVTPEQQIFTQSFDSEGYFAGFWAENIKLNEEDYKLTIDVEVCNERGCEMKKISGILKLEIKKYRSNDVIDKLLSP